MLKTQNNAIYRQDINELVTKTPQTVSEAICMEEPAELIQAINKTIRYRSGDTTVGSWERIRENLLEEMADTLISVDILKVLYEISDYELDAALQHKTLRNIQRLRERDMPEEIKRAFAAAHECCGGDHECCGNCHG